MATKKKIAEKIEQIAEEDCVNLPEKVSVAGYNVAIRPMVGYEEHGFSANGLYDNGEIMLSMNNDPQRIAMALVHELIHACFDHSGLRIKYLNYHDTNIEEEVVTQLGYTLTQIIATDKNLVDFIQKAFNGTPVMCCLDALQQKSSPKASKKIGVKNDRVCIK